MEKYCTVAIPPLPEKQISGNVKVVEHSIWRGEVVPIEKLSVVAHSLIVSRILYALPAWGGFLSAELSGKLDALLRRLKRVGYIRDG